MKFAVLPTRAASNAFTLIELLVVMAIIATLMAISSQVARVVMQRTRIAQAKVQIVSLKNAMLSYHHEYGSFPIAVAGSQPTEGLLMQSLMGDDGQAAQRLNPRKVVFFTTGSNTGNPTAPGFVPKLWRLNDPWGTPFELTVDSEDSGTVNLPEPYQDTYGPGLPGHRVFIHSAGPDRDFGTIEDNVHELR